MEEGHTFPCSPWLPGYYRSSSQFFLCTMRLLGKGPHTQVSALTPWTPRVIGLLGPVTGPSMPGHVLKLFFLEFCGFCLC